MTETRSSYPRDDLLNLPVSALGKVELWLTYRQLKPVSAVALRKRLRVSDGGSRLESLVVWLKSAGLYHIEDRHDSKIIHISKNEKFAFKSSRIFWSKKYSDVVKLGELFGYPKEATKIFALQVSYKECDQRRGQLKVVTSRNFRKILPYYWWQYVRYVVRSGRVYEDSLQAKKWADMIGRDLPALADEFQKKLGESW